MRLHLKIFRKFFVGVTILTLSALIIFESMGLFSKRVVPFHYTFTLKRKNWKAVDVGKFHTTPELNRSDDLSANYPGTRRGWNWSENDEHDNSKFAIVREKGTSRQWTALTKHVNPNYVPMAMNEISAKQALGDYKYEDIMNMKPIRFLPNYKNPCWIGTNDNGPINDGKLHCLPYFYVIGIKKSGTSDLFFKIVQHPDVASPGFKEAQWFPRRRFLIKTLHLANRVQRHIYKYDPRTLEYYIRMFQTATHKIASNHRNVSDTKHNMITGEGSPSNVYMSGVWDLLPGNRDLKEPKYTNLHYIQHLVPHVKMIIIFRHPVDRLFSDFHFMARGKRQKKKSPEDFHTEAQTAITSYQNCFQYSTMGSCLHNYTLFRQFSRSFSFPTAFYSFYMKELLDVFPKAQILPLLFDDYVSKPVDTMQRVYDFLGLRKIDSKWIERICNHTLKNKSSKKRQPMLPKTREMLESFFQPYNIELAELTGDSRFLFERKAKTKYNG